MTPSFQVNFRRLLPSEELVALANERYQHIRQARAEAQECWVSLEGLEPSNTRLVQAVVTINHANKPLAQATAVDRVPSIALSLAMAQVQVRLGVRPEVSTLRFLASAEPTPLRRAVGAR